MSGSWQIGRVAGIPVRVHWSFGILVLLVVALTAGSGGLVVLGSLGWLAFLFGSVVFHEFAHSLVARSRGLTVRDIVLLPIGGASEIPDLDRSPDDEFRIAIAGPLASVVLAVALGAVALALGLSLWPPSLVGGAVVVRMAWVNLLLAGFNLLPALPLDGGRVLRSLLSRHRDQLRATLVAARTAQVIAAAMIVLGMAVDVWLSVIGVFVMLGAVGERRNALVRAALGGRRVADLTVPLSAVLPGAATVARTVAENPGGAWFPVPVVDDHGYAGMVDPQLLAAAPPDALLSDVADRSVPLLDPDTPLFPDALRALSASRRPSLPVGRDRMVRGSLRAVDVEALLRTPAPVPH